MDHSPSSRHEYIMDGRTNLVINTETREIFNPEGFPFKLSETLSLDGLYEHYKSTFHNPKYYLVSGVAENTETGECFVLYEPFYETEEVERFARPLKMFTEEVEVDGRSTPRFRFVTDNIEYLK